VWLGRQYHKSRLERREQAEAEKLSRQAPPVKTFVVRSRAVAGTLKRIGTIRARAETNLQFGAAGQVQTFSVERGQFVKKGALLAALDQAESRNVLNAARLEFAQATEKFLDRTIGQMDYERAKARWTQARLESAKTAVHAPHDGYLVEKWVNQGEHVEGGAVIGKLMDKSKVTVEMDLSEDDSRYLKPGQTVRVTVDAVPDYAAQGRVTVLTPYLKGDTRSFGVKVDLPENPGEALNPGMFARCEIRRYEKNDALVVPVSAGGALDQKTVTLYTVTPQNKVHIAQEPVLFQDGDWIEAGGLVPGQQVILNPGPDLREGATVAVSSTWDPDAAAPPPAPKPGA
jgi:multidrug efflux pump subunit AcrA (membrane-fusion protein)